MIWYAKYYWTMVDEFSITDIQTKSFIKNVILPELILIRPRLAAYQPALDECDKIINYINNRLVMASR